MSKATPANPGKPGSVPTAQPCAHCGVEVFYSVSMSSGSRWLHADTYKVRCK